MNQTEYVTRSPRRSSQCDKILACLEAQPGRWVAMPALVEISGAYAVHSRVSDLRKAGHHIEQQSRIVAGHVHSSYRLVPAGAAPDTTG